MIISQIIIENILINNEDYRLIQSNLEGFHNGNTTSIITNSNRNCYCFNGNLDAPNECDKCGQKMRIKDHLNVKLKIFQLEHIIFSLL